MKICVILCTYNRGSELKHALASLVRSEMDNSVDWEVLVVDNNSNDNTPAVVQECIDRYPARVRYVFEPTPGRSHALNRGIAESHAEILAFTDDDVIVEPTWLKNLTHSISASTYAGASGRTLPATEFRPPHWLPMNKYFALAPLALFDRGLESKDLLEAPFGNNMAFRRVVFERYGVFRVDIGRTPGTVLGSEDSEFGERLLAAGEKLRYEPAAVLYHAVPAQRVTRKYFRAWWHDKTRSDVRAFGIRRSRWQVAGIPLYLFRRLLRWTGQMMISIRPVERFRCQIQLATVIGSIRECHYQSHRAEAVVERNALELSELPKQ